MINLLEFEEKEKTGNESIFFTLDHFTRLKDDDIQFNWMIYGRKKLDTGYIEEIGLVKEISYPYSKIDSKEFYEKVWDLLEEFNNL